MDILVLIIRILNPKILILPGTIHKTSVWHIHIVTGCTSWSHKSFTSIFTFTQNLPHSASVVSSLLICSSVSLKPYPVSAALSLPTMSMGQTSPINLRVFAVHPSTGHEHMDGGLVQLGLLLTSSHLHIEVPQGLTPWLPRDLLPQYPALPPGCLQVQDCGLSVPAPWLLRDLLPKYPSLPPGCLQVQDCRLSVPCPPTRLPASIRL